MIDLDQKMSNRFNQLIDNLFRLINESLRDINIQKNRIDEIFKILTAGIEAGKTTVRHIRQQ